MLEWNMTDEEQEPSWADVVDDIGNRFGRMNKTGRFLYTLATPEGNIVEGTLGRFKGRPWLGGVPLGEEVIYHIQSALGHTGVQYSIISVEAYSSNKRCKSFIVTCYNIHVGRVFVTIHR